MREKEIEAWMMQGRRYDTEPWEQQISETSFSDVILASAA